MTQRERGRLFFKKRDVGIVCEALKDIHNQSAFRCQLRGKLSSQNQQYQRADLSIWAKKFSQYEEEDTSSDIEGHDVIQITYKAFDILKYFLTRFEIKTFTLNFQLKNYNFTAKEAYKIVINNCLKTLEIGHSTLSFDNLLILTQIQGLKKIIIHNSVITDQHSTNMNNDDGGDLVANYSVQQLQFYKNKLSQTIQEKFFKILVPLLVNMKKLYVPTNQLIDNTTEALIKSVLKHQHLEALFIGSNHFHPESVLKLMTAMVRQKKTLTMLDLTFCDLNRFAIDKIGELLKENKSLQILSLKGCGLDISDLQLFNDKLRENKKSPLVELNICLNRVTDMQVQAKFNTSAMIISPVVSNDSPTNEKQNQVIDNPIMKVVALPITPLLLGIYDCLKMY